MIKLWIYTETTCVWQDIENLSPWDDFSFVKRNQSVCIQYQNQKKVLKPNTSCMLNQTLFYLDAKESSVSHFPISNVIQIGRSEACDICLCIPGISRFHLQIENGVLKDLNSLNGTYVNKKRTKQCELSMQDEIVFSNVRMIYFKTHILLDMVDNPYLSKENKIQEVVYPANVLHVDYPKIKKWDIQMPQSLPALEKQSLMQAIGPSLMIAGSGVVSSLVVSLLQNQEGRNTVFSMISSLTMSFTFLLYGLYNRNYQYKIGLQKEQESKALYERYLKQIGTQIMSDYQEFEKQVHLYIKTYVQTLEHEMNDQIYIGNQKGKFAQINERNIPYENALDALVVQRTQCLDLLKKPCTEPVFLMQHQIAWLDMDMQDVCVLFENYLWYTKRKRKWIWLECFDDMQRILLNPYFGLCEKPTSDTVVVTTDPLKLPNLYYCLMYVSRQKPSFPYDYHIQTIDVYPLKEEQRRFLAKVQENDFYEELILSQPKRYEKYCMRVPVGMDEKNQIIYMDFKTLGPHGLVAGMTGYGKSEFISFLLMMLIWHNSPSHFQYILIDFKGGAFGQPFYNFNHCAGIVTNLDLQSMERFFQSMNFELEKRQKIFLKAKVSDIDAYNEISTLSHLWIFVDEFAQLKLKFPQCMTQLQEIARIGRSLGVHLVLSTQKPAGIIDEQVWSNTTWKACFHVSSKQDSREVLQIEDAYALKNPGDVILQSGVDRFDFRSFYLQERVGEKYWKEINIKKEIVRYKSHAGKRLMECLESKLSLLREEKNWVLLPKVLPKNVWGILDLPFLQSQKELNFERIQLIYTNHVDVIHSLIWYFQKETLYVYGSVEFDLYVDHSFTKPRFFSFVKKGILFVFSEEEIDLSLVSDDVKIFIFTQNPNTNWKWISKKYVFDVESMDEKRIFFDTFHLPPFSNVTSYKNTYVECLYRKVEPSRLFVKKYQKLIFQRPENCIGFDVKTDVPVFVDEKRKLYILHMQENIDEELEWICEKLRHFKFSTNWKDQSDIYVIHVNTKLLNDSLFLQTIYDGQIIWIGYGLKEHGYTLKRKIPYGNFKIVYFEDQEEGRGICE